MTDFDLAVSGVEIIDWADPSRFGWVSRVNPRSGHTLRRYVATVGVPVVLTGVLVTPYGSVVAPIDGLLGGRLFFAASLETPTPSPVGWSASAGLSSVQTFVPRYPGNYLVYLRRTGGGGHMIRVDAREAT